MSSGSRRPGQASGMTQDGRSRFSAANPGQAQTSLYGAVMRPVKYRFGSYVLTGLTAPALEAQVAAEGSLRRSYKARHNPA